MNAFEKGRKYAEDMGDAITELPMPNVSGDDIKEFIEGFLFSRFKVHRTGGTRPRFDFSYSAKKLPDTVKGWIHQYWYNYMKFKTKMNVTSHSDKSYHRYNIGTEKDVEKIIKALGRNRPEVEHTMRDSWKAKQRELVASKQRRTNKNMEDVFSTVGTPFTGGTTDGDFVTVKGKNGMTYQVLRSDIL